MKLIDKLEIVEKYIILLLGVVNKPIPSILHLEKEMFILTRVNPRVEKFIPFIKHYKGPYSDVINDLVRNPIYYTKAYEIINGKIYLTQEGKKIFNELVKTHEKDERFRELLATLRMIRNLYDKLSEDELLLLIYTTYPEYTEKSKVTEELLSKKRRTQIARKLLKKGMITERRYKEILEYENQGNT